MFIIDLSGIEIYSKNVFLPFATYQRLGKD